MISEMLKKDSRLVGLNLLGDKEEGLDVYVIIEINQFEMLLRKQATG